MNVLDELDGMGIEPLPMKVVTPETEAPMHAQWAKYRPAFAEAMAGGLHSIEDMDRKLAQGRAILFPGKDSAIIAEKVDYATGTSVFQATWSIGDLAEILTLAPGVEAIGRSLGCTEMLIEGRKGWERILKTLGYEPWSITVRKAL